MAHEVETMAYVNDMPWHQLGQKLAPNQPIEIWSKQSGMDFTILEAPVQFSVLTTDEHSTSMFPEQKVLYRSDTKAPLSIVSSRYQIVQPKEILEFYRDLTEIAGFELETAGVMKGGRKLWALARTHQSSFIKGNDLMHAYLLLATGCDGTLATTAQFTSIRVVCNNTLAISLEQGKSAIKVPHNTRFNAAVVKQQLGISIPSWDNFMYRMMSPADVN
jgi:phage/plasmid-like protein (TIGR03299 family)